MKTIQSLSYKVLSGKVTRTGAGATKEHAPAKSSSYSIALYDLSSPAVLQGREANLVRDIELAKLGGVSGFCFCPWIDEQPANTSIEHLLAPFIENTPHILFCIGLPTSELSCSTGALNLMRKLSTSPAYIKIAGVPLVVLLGALPDLPLLSRQVAALRSTGPFHVALATLTSSAEITLENLDATIALPRTLGSSAAASPDALQKEVLDIISLSSGRQGKTGIPTYPTASPLRSNMGSLSDIAPRLFGAWLRYLNNYAVAAGYPQTPIFIDAWNRTGNERSMKPDQQFEQRWIEEAARATWSCLGNNIESREHAFHELTREISAILLHSSTPPRRRSADQSYPGRRKWFHTAANILRPYDFIHRPARAVYLFVKTSVHFRRFLHFTSNFRREGN